jgi:type I restriction enzyme M protein
VFTNPPFGTKIPVDDRAILEQFDLACMWDYDEAADSFSVREPRAHRPMPPEILFIERCVRFLKPGTGIVALVLPDAILGAPGRAFVREWILQHTTVLASIDLHPDTFQPKNNTQTSLLVLRRKSAKHVELERAAGKKQAYNVFMAIANHIGHDKRGNTTYVRDDKGNVLLQTRKERIREVQDGVPVYRDVESAQKVIDDNTLEIASRFRQWRKEQL